MMTVPSPASTPRPDPGVPRQRAVRGRADRRRARHAVPAAGLDLRSGQVEVATITPSSKLRSPGQGCPAAETRSSRRRRPASSCRSDQVSVGQRRPASWPAGYRSSLTRLLALAPLVRRGVRHRPERRPAYPAHNATVPPACHRSTQIATATSTSSPVRQTGTRNNRSVLPGRITGLVE